MTERPEHETRIRREPATDAAGTSRASASGGPAERRESAIRLLRAIELALPDDRPRLERELSTRLAAERDPATAAILLRASNRLRALLALETDPSRAYDRHVEESWQRIEAILRGEVRPGTAGPGGSPSLADRYEIVEPIASGGMARVYLARRRRDGRLVAIKLLLEKYLAGGSSARRRFVRECELLQGVSHPRIVRVYEHGTFEGRPYLVMEYLPRGSLADHLGDAELDTTRARTILADAAEALAWLHSRRMVHRDVKPANILVDDEWRGRLADFGLARDPRSALTVHGQHFGSPAYMAPEQRADASTVTPAADVYSLGVSIYEVLSRGRLPEVDYLPLAELAKDVPAGLDDVVRACLRHDPRQRPEARAVEEALR